MMTAEELLAATESPLVRVVRGKPTPEELVALVAGLIALQDATPNPHHRSFSGRSAWTDRAALLNTHPFRPSAGNWARSSSR